jgi:hypothetical protein
MIRMYAWPRRDGFGKRPARSAADQSFRGTGCSFRNQLTALEVRGESRGNRQKRELVRGMRVVTGPRMESGKTLRVDAMPRRRRSRCPNAVERERGGNFRTREAVDETTGEGAGEGGDGGRAKGTM